MIVICFVLLFGHTVPVLPQCPEEGTDRMRPILGTGSGFEGTCPSEGTGVWRRRDRGRVVLKGQDENSKNGRGRGPHAMLSPLRLLSRILTFHSFISPGACAARGCYTLIPQPYSVAGDVANHIRSRQVAAQTHESIGWIIELHLISTMGTRLYFSAFYHLWGHFLHFVSLSLHALTP